MTRLLPAIFLLLFATSQKAEAQFQELRAFDIITSTNLPEPIQFDKNWIKEKRIREISASYYLKRPSRIKKADEIIKWKFDKQGNLTRFFNGKKYKGYCDWQFEYPDSLGCVVLYELAGKKQLKIPGLEEYTCDTAGRLTKVGLPDVVDSIVYNELGEISERHEIYRVAEDAPPYSIYETHWLHGPEGRFERSWKKTGMLNENDSLVYCQSGITTFEYIGTLLTREYIRSADVQYFPEIGRFDTIASSTMEIDYTWVNESLKSVMFIENDEYLGELEVKVSLSYTENFLVSEMVYTKPNSKEPKPFYRIRIAYEFWE